jgi:hypothetical protein
MWDGECTYMKHSMSICEKMKNQQKCDTQNISIEKKIIRWVEGVAFWYKFIYVLLMTLICFVSK